MEKICNDLLNIEGIKSVIVMSNDGNLIYKGNVKEEDIEVISAIMGAIFGGAEKFKQTIGDKIKYVIIGGNSSKIMLFKCDGKIIGVIGGVKIEEIKDKILECFSQ